MASFELSKWYMDCVSEAGDVVVVYAARLRWRAITLHYSSLLVRAPGAEARTETSMRAALEPTLSGDELTWSSEALDVSGRWSRLAPPVEATVFDSPDGKVVWRCSMPRARAEITLGERTVRGFGYTEHLLLTVEPWRMPIDELRWGRFVGERSALVWIDWRGRHAKQVVFCDGDALGPVRIDDRSVEGGGVRLAIDEGGSLRRGALGATALARVPGLERFPARILAVDEHKWCARATLHDARGEDRGWAIHEVVRWPAAPAAEEKPRAPSQSLGKLAYGLLFVALLPALLVAWARSTESVVTAPAWHAPRIGLGLAASGALLVLAGWAALWRHGGGLPMNAFPPPRYVARGVYALLAHPIYVGFVAICFGVSIATGSASGLWLVSPTAALGALTLVLGYEALDLDARFGRAREKPWISLPPATDEAPSLSRRLSALALAIAPWLALFAAEARLDPREAGICALALLAPFAVATERALRTLVLRSLLAMPLVLPLHALVPSLHASPLPILALLTADAFTSRAPWATWPGRALAVLVAWLASAHCLGANVIAYLFAASAGSVWRALRAASEWVANSWHETRVGPMRIINHGIWGGLSACGGIFIIGTCCGPGHFLGVIAISAACLVGAALWAQTIEGSSALSRPYGFYGGLLGICLAALAGPLVGTPTWLLLGAVSVAGPYMQAVGRVRCLVQGCCHGSETSEAVGIRYHHPRSRVCRLAHLDGIPLHATQLYSILWNALSLVVVARLWSLHVPLHLVGGVYLILNGIGRFSEEAYRGEPQTPIYARLRLYQWVSLVQIVAGALVTALGKSPHAPPAEPSLEAFAVAAVFGVIYWFALGVDFPESNRRFSRLA